MSKFPRWLKIPLILITINIILEFIMLTFSVIGYELSSKILQAPFYYFNFPFAFLLTKYPQQIQNILDLTQKTTNNYIFALNVIFITTIHIFIIGLAIGFIYWKVKNKRTI